MDPCSHNKWVHDELIHAEHPTFPSTLGPPARDPVADGWLPSREANTGFGTLESSSLHDQ